MELDLGSGGEPTFVFTQDGDTVTGTYDYGEAGGGTWTAKKAG